MWFYFCQVKVKGRYSSSWGNPTSELHDVTCHMIWDHKCYLPPDTSEHTPPNPSHAGWYSIYLPRRDGRLSWPSWLDSAPAGSRTSDLSITSPTPNHCTTKTGGGHLWSIGHKCKFCNFSVYSRPRPAIPLFPLIQEVQFKSTKSMGVMVQNPESTFLWLTVTVTM